MAAIIFVRVLGEISLVQALISGLVLYVTLVFTRQRYFSVIGDIPGPFLGTFGTCFQLWEISRGRINQRLAQLHTKFGTITLNFNRPFVRISYNEVSVNHPEAIQILAAPLWKSDWYKIFATPNSSYKNLMSECDPKKHVAMRSNLASGYSGSSALRSESSVDQTIQVLERRLDELSQRKEAFDLSRWLLFFAWDINGEVMFSTRFGFLDQGRDIGNSIKNNFGLALYVTVTSYAQWLHMLALGNPILRWLDFQPKQHTFNTTVKAVLARKKNPEAKADMMEQWMGFQARHPDRMTEKDVLAAAVSNLGAGGGTVGSVLQAFFYLLLKGNPVHLKRLREEIDRASAARTLSRVVSNAEALRLPYLQACIRETLRLYPGVPWNLPRVVPNEGLTVAGHHFAHGTILSVNPWLIHRNQECFGKDADDYNPERWLGDTSAVKRMEKFWIPFGLGYNACPGRNVANLELNKVTATLVRDFDIRLADPDAEWRYHELFVTSRNGWPVYIRRRSMGKGLVGENPMIQ
ncbi:benzoate 4-monooxygenase cytochrome P450 [Usnea florida]